jgi:hypothetical protein
MRHSKLFIEMEKRKIEGKGGINQYRGSTMPEPERFPSYLVDLPYSEYCPAFETLLFGNISIDREDYDEKVWNVKNHLITCIPGAKYWLSITRDDVSTLHIVVTFPEEKYDMAEIKKTFASVISLARIAKLPPKLCDKTIKHFNFYMDLCELDANNAAAAEATITHEK